MRLLVPYPQPVRASHVPGTRARPAHPAADRTSRRRGRPAASAAGALACGLLLAACGSVLQGPDPDPDDQDVVVAPSDLPAPVASEPRVGAATKTNYLTGEDVPDSQVLAVKIDNSPAARPQAGVTQADVVYVEEVEGGTTRLLVVFQTELPGEVGPIRSARTSDIFILGNYDSPGFAFSGGNSGVVAELQAADLSLVSFDSSREGYSRSGARRAPYNVMGNAGQLLARVPDAGNAVDIGFRFGAAAEGGRPAAGASYAWSGARIDFEWSAGEERWLQSMGGQPSPAAEGGRLGADTVVFQSVPVVPSQYVDVNGSRSPEVRPVGEGAVTVLRDGQVFEGRWSRPGLEDPTTFTTAGGEELTLDVGQTWVVYVDEGTAPTLR
jgi:hypothetical protein